MEVSFIGGFLTYDYLLEQAPVSVSLFSMEKSEMLHVHRNLHVNHLSLWHPADLLNSSRIKHI